MIRDQFTRRPDNRAGDIKPIWPIEPPAKCGLDWLVIIVWTVMGLGVISFWLGAAWLFGLLP